ncbi:MAG: acylphosphatase [Chlamydiae bacterium]|jgi:acylphosphatase|nr:acylphosphatase [Chlamydiota bacterium]
MIYVLKIRGLVQGVGFRNTTKKMAKKLGLKGFTRNLLDVNEVEVIVDAPTKEALSPLVSFLKDSFQIETLSLQELSDFEIL